MTFEQATYYKYLLLCGYTDELNQHIDTSLSGEDPLSDVILNLSACGSDNKKILTALNDFISTVSKEKIDNNKVFLLVLNFLRRQYFEEKMPIEKLTDLMYEISVVSENVLENPWWTMNILGDLYSEARAGYITMESFMDAFESFINKGICLESSFIQPSQKQQSFLKRLIMKLKSKK